MEKNALDWIALILLVIGGLNWGLVGVFGYDLIDSLFGSSIITTIIYDLVGLSALYSIYYLFKN